MKKSITSRIILIIFILIIIILNVPIPIHNNLSAIEIKMNDSEPNAGFASDSGRCIVSNVASFDDALRKIQKSGMFP